jgi:DNA-binding transcriptional LysR family regulator
VDIQALSAFVAVSESHSFSRAAEQLFITQPAVSKRISALENQLNTRLFDRIGKTVQLTEAGRALLPSAQRILAELEESRRAIGNLNQRVDGTLKLATSHHIGLHRLPPVLREFTTLYPEVDLDIRFMDSEEACSSVLKGEVELAVATLPERDWQQLISQTIWHDPLDIVISAQHPAAKQLNLSIDTLRNLPAILPARNTFTRVLLEQALG